MDVKAHLPVQLSTTVTLSQEHPVRNGFSEAVCKVVRSGLAVTSSKIGSVAFFVIPRGELCPSGNRHRTSNSSDTNLRTTSSKS
jgi:hypothetical protein